MCCSGALCPGVFCWECGPIQANVIEEGHIGVVKFYISEELGASVGFSNHWYSLCIQEENPPVLWQFVHLQVGAVLKLS